MSEVKVKRLYDNNVIAQLEDMAVVLAEKATVGNHYAAASQALRIAANRIHELEQQQSGWPDIKEFIEEVERRAEAHMLKTGKLEGAHYRAMKDYYAECQAACDARNGGEG